MYGHREILLNYFAARENLSDKTIIEGSIDHSWAFDENLWRLRKRNLAKSNRYVWNYRQQDLLKHVYKTTAVGSPWLYMLENLGIRKANAIDKLPKIKNKVLILPGHNAIDSRKDFKSTVNDFKKLVSFSNNILVSLYWLDFCDPETRRIYEKEGWGVVCAGYVPRLNHATSIIGGRHNFLLETFNYMKDTEYIITDDFSTGSLYALSLGAKMIYIKNDESILHMKSQRKFRARNHLPGFFGTPDDWIMNYFPELLKTKDTPQKFIDFAWNELGEKSFAENIITNKIKWKQVEISEVPIQKYREKIATTRENLNL